VHGHVVDRDGGSEVDLSFAYGSEDLLPLVMAAGLPVVALIAFALVVFHGEMLIPALVSVLWSFVVLAMLRVRFLIQVRKALRTLRIVMSPGVDIPHGPLISG
jgi:hypothetical protein